ncbi:ABC transporter permease [Parapedobacter lycopersici]|uniref:ABC transporter permease n=1 Tax=Parapedobacter lycopersici TaxID=1864939 RepID=UPI00214DA617|nr:ABC transporter permease [Parapedobacter lycopersici]
MIRNYLKIAFRNLVKNKVYSTINITGLAISLAATILILLWVWDELGYDRMHSKADRIYQLSSTFDITSDNLWPVGPPPLAEFGKAEIPGIETATRLWKSRAVITTINDNHKFTEKGQHVDPAFFEIFDFPLLAGDRQHLFPDNQSIILTKALAKKYFGNNEALGQTVLVNMDPLVAAGERNFTVTGVIDDFPLNSSIQTDFLLPFDLLDEIPGTEGISEQWGNFGFPTYFLLKAGTDPQKAAKQLVDIHRKNNESEFFNRLVYFLQPLEKVHLFDAKGTERGMQQVRIFVLVAGIILLIACVNYVNLITARTARRGKEVGVRKVVGANRTHLFYQFITESVLVFLIATVLAIALTYVGMPLYNNLSGKEMEFSLLDTRIWLLFGSTLLAVVILAGIYPALLLTTFNPIPALKGMMAGIGKNSGLRKTLVVFQFSCSIILIISTIMISRQLDYIRQKELGYDKANVFLFPQLNFLSRFEAIRTELERQPGIRGVTAASGDISNMDTGTGDIEWEGKPATMANYMVSYMAIDHKFMDVLDVQLTEGRGLTGTPADSGYMLLNETAVKQMGLKNPIGMSIVFRDRPRTVIGVIKDFHFNDLKQAIGPCVLFSDSRYALGGMYVKTSGTDASLALDAVKKLWKQYNSAFELDYHFMDESFDNFYKSDIQVGKLFNIFAGIAILISCLGLFGLVTFTAETKVKEIGIRKTLGASVTNVVLLISRDFLLLVGLSLLVAFPVGWWMMNSWLANYVYHTGIEWWVFVVAGTAAFAIAAITVCGKSVKAAQENPIKALRTE